MKLAAAFLAFSFACVAFAHVHPGAVAQAPTAKPQKPTIWIVSGLSNIHKDSEDEQGHGVGDDLTVIVQGDTAVGALSELEGSQQDPKPTCLTGTYGNGFLRLESHPEDVTYGTEKITIQGKRYAIPHGHAFHGSISGGPFRSDRNSKDPHFPAIVTLRVRDEQHSDDPADWRASGTCACQ
jgi:hypothetical protein